LRQSVPIRLANTAARPANKSFLIIITV
jgi:hypothetical protein